ncbi:hypothetical protein [Gordonia hankookensis]|uniref:Uncharacterized protein n=1 Tax=Gordonia hankookensis TaxID=589403 RepID=A0ABR7W963_9ACTN|nr:hypothetical protein [Gordonia hankookensis]MBD1319346.1 hypothetical protein [Gordonia hankookensis]
MVKTLGQQGYEQVLTAVWTPQAGVEVPEIDLPAEWEVALRRVGHDLRARQYAGRIERIDWVGEYDDHSGYVAVLSSVTSEGRPAEGLGTCEAAPLDSTEDEIARYLAYVVQDEVARAHVAWPWADGGGFCTPRLADDEAVWVDGRGQNIGQIGRLGDTAG